MKQYSRKSQILRQINLFSMVETRLLDNTKMAFYIDGEVGLGYIISETEEFYVIGRHIDTLKLECEKVEEFSGKRIKDCKHGYCSHLIFLTEDGKIYAVGNNESGQLGTTEDEIESDLVVVGQPLINANVSEVACGPEYSLAVTSKGEIFFWGTLDFAYQNSQPKKAPCLHDEMDCQLASCINAHKVVQIASGMRFVLALSENGHVYSWGRNNKGQLGQGHADSYNNGSPVRVTDLEDIAKVVCGRNHCLALSKNGDLFAWGDNEFGQLGTGDKTTVFSPKRVAENIGKIQDITASNFFNISAALSDETIYVWGSVRSKWIEPSPTKTNYEDFTQLFIGHNIYPIVLKVGNSSEKENYEEFVDSWKQAFDVKTTSDLTIKIEDRHIYVHKAVLAIRCQYFKDHFEGACGDTQISEMSIDQFKYSTYRTFLYYLYTGDFSASTDEIIDLMEVANVYGEERLLKRCSNLLKQEVNTENVVRILNTAIKYKLNELEEICINYAGIVLKDICKTEAFGGLNADTLQKIIIRAQHYESLI